MAPAEHHSPGFSVLLYVTPEGVLRPLGVKCGNHGNHSFAHRYPPFFDDNPFGIYQKILSGKLDFPRHLDFYVK